MAQYVTDEQGQIMVRDQKGNTKYFHTNIINNRMLMERMGFTPVPKPEAMEPKRTLPIPPKSVQSAPDPLEPAKSESVKIEPSIDFSQPIPDNLNPAENSEAKRRGRPPLNK